MAIVGKPVEWNGTRINNYYTACVHAFYDSLALTLTLQMGQQILRWDMYQQTDHRDLSPGNAWDHHSPYPHSPM
jgi:hypothetical protein